MVRTGERRDHEQFARARDQCRGDAGLVIGLDAVGIDEGERAHRLVVGRTRGITLEQLRDRAFAGGDDTRSLSFANRSSSEIPASTISIAAAPPTVSMKRGNSRAGRPMCCAARSPTKPKALFPDPSGAATAIRMPVMAGASGSRSRARACVPRRVPFRIRTDWKGLSPPRGLRHCGSARAGPCIQPSAGRRRAAVRPGRRRRW